MSDTPISMEKDGYGSVRSKHVTPWMVHTRNCLVDGCLSCSDLLPDIATLRHGTHEIALASNDERMHCALRNFFGTHEVEGTEEEYNIWKNGYPKTEINCALICLPKIGHKTLLHCKEEKKHEGKPVYYYWKMKGEGESKKLIMNVMVDKEFCHYRKEEIWEDYCCEFEIGMCVGEHYQGSIRESIYDTNRPSGMGFCFCGCWLFGDAPGRSVIGRPINWFTGEDIANGTEQEDGITYYAVANQDYIVDSAVDYTDETGCYRGVYLSAISTKEAWGAPYIYIGNGEFENHKDMLNDILGPGWNVNVYDHLIGTAITAGKMPGFYKDDDGCVVFVQTCSYQAEVYLRDLTGCLDFGYVPYGDGVEVDHEARIAPSQREGSFDKNPKVYYGEHPLISGENFLSWYMTYWVNIRHIDGEPPPGDVNWEQEMQFTTDEQVMTIKRQKAPPYQNDTSAVDFTQKKNQDGKWVVTFKFDPSGYHKAGCSRVPIFINGYGNTISLNRKWSSWEPFPSSSPAYNYNPPVHV